METPHSRPTRRHLVAAVAVLLVGGLGLAGCFTGKRPTFRDDSTVPAATTGNADIDAVLGLLDSVADAEFTAGYSIETKFNSVSSTGLVVQATGQRRSITVDNVDRSVRFIIDGSDERTCDLRLAECEASLNDARISDTQLPHTFYGPAFAARLRADADRRIGDPVAYDETIAGQTAKCVDVAVGGGTKTYCALTSGPLAEFVGADVTIELTSFSPQPDDTKFTSSN